MVMDVKVDGTFIKDTLEGIGNFGSAVREWITGEPSPEKKLEILKMADEVDKRRDTIDQALANGQMEINKIEAASTSLFVSGWRPAVGWCCVLGLIYTFGLQPLLKWGSSIWNIAAPPVLDTAVLLELLFGMLGLAGFRSWEKKSGVARQ